MLTRRTSAAIPRRFLTYGPIRGPLWGRVSTVGQVTGGGWCTTGPFLLVELPTHRSQNVCHKIYPFDSVSYRFLERVPVC